MGESGVPGFGPRWGGGGEGKGRKGRSCYRSAVQYQVGRGNMQYNSQSDGKAGGERTEEERREEKRREEDGKMESMYVNDREGEEDSCVVRIICRMSWSYLAWVAIVDR